MSQKMVHRIAACALLLASLAAHANSVLVADVAAIESASGVVKRLQAQALAAQAKAGDKSNKLTGKYLEAFEQSLSPFRQSLPVVIAEIAREQKADAVLSPDILRIHKLSGASISAEVQKRLDQKFATLSFRAP
jgi:Ni,Fe-hydrogenase maturation factor